MVAGVARTKIVPDLIRLEAVFNMGSVPMRVILGYFWRRY